MKKARRVERVSSETADPGNRHWHLEDVELVDVTIEACDGTADFVDENLDVYLDLGNYCPWSAVVVAIERE